ncbi:MAG: AAA family ATPase [Pseudomonadota bacterium]|nr:AAA family ATPase [Pseudomonadota bacterium]
MNFMLHRFAFSNFQSFRERTEVNWLLDGKVPEAVWSVTGSAGMRASTVMAVIGPNASGKTGVLSALVFVLSFAFHSFAADPQAKIAFSPYALFEGEPSEFEIEFEWDGKLWRYVLRCTRERVLHEALYVKRQRMGYVFLRDWAAGELRYEVKRQPEFDLPIAEAAKARANASLISTGAQYGVSLAQRMVQANVSTNLDFRGRIGTGPGPQLGAAHYFAHHPDQLQQAIRLMRTWDFGLHAIELRAQELALENGKTERVWIPFGIHRDRRGKPFELPLQRESSGTQSVFVLLRGLLDVLESGGLAIVDEFENDLHPHMLEPILSLFADKATNPHGAQLLFTCHAMEVLNILHKSQVMLVEKDEGSESTAWRLDSVEGIRSDDNFYAKYMAGAYGAVPQL